MQRKKTSTGSDVESKENNTKKQLNELASRKHFEERNKNSMEDNLWHLERQKYEYITRAETVKDKLNTLKKSNAEICKNIDEVKANLSKLGAEIKADYPESYDIPNDSISRLKQEEQRIMNKRRKEIEKEQAKKNKSESVAEGNSDQESSSQQLAKDNNSKESSPEELALERNEQKQQELKNKMAKVSGLSSKHSESDEELNLLVSEVNKKKEEDQIEYDEVNAELAESANCSEINNQQNKFKVGNNSNKNSEAYQWDSGSESDEAINLLYAKLNSEEQEIQLEYEKFWSNIKEKNNDLEIQNLSRQFDNTLGEYAKAVTDDAPEF